MYVRMCVCVYVCMYVCMLSNVPTVFWNAIRGELRVRVACVIDGCIYRHID